MKYEKYIGIFRDVRKARNSTLAKMGAFFDRSESTISLWESGKRRPPIDIFLWYMEEANQMASREVDCPRCGGTGQVTTIIKCSE